MNPPQLLPGGLLPVGPAHQGHVQGHLQLPPALPVQSLELINEVVVAGSNSGVVIRNNIQGTAAASIPVEAANVRLHDFTDPASLAAAPVLQAESHGVPPHENLPNLDSVISAQQVEGKVIGGNNQGIVVENNIHTTGQNAVFPGARIANVEIKRGLKRKVAEVIAPEVDDSSEGSDAVSAPDSEPPSDASLQSNGEEFDEQSNDGSSAASNNTEQEYVNDDQEEGDGTDDEDEEPASGSTESSSADDQSGEYQPSSADQSDSDD